MTFIRKVDRLTVPAIVFAGALVALCAYDLSPLINWPGVDGAVFIYVARSMQNGLVPYLDVFDHKGPFIYIFNWLGLSTGMGTYGIWLLDVLLFGLSLAYAVKWVRRLFGALPCALFALIYFATLAYSCQGGNVTETWATYFIILIVINLAKRIQQFESRWDDFVVGVCISIILLLRPNMLACGIVYCMHVLAEAISKKDVRLFARRTILVVAGMLCVLLPVLLWLGLNGALIQCWEAYIVFNMKYLSAGSSIKEVNPRLWYSLLLVALPTAFFFLQKDGEQRKVLRWLFFTCVLSWAVVALKTSFSHYFVVLAAPMGAYAAASIKNVRFKYFTACVWLPVALWLTYLLLCGTVFHVVHLPTLKQMIADRRMPSSFRSITWGYNDKYDRLEKIRPMIKDPNSVIVLGNDCTVYEKLGLRTTTKYPYCSPITRISDKIHDEVGSAMTSGADRYVIMAKGYSEFPAELLARVPYKEIGETEDYSLYERSIDCIEN